MIREWELISSGIVRTSVWAEPQVISGVLLGGTSQSLEHASQGVAVLAIRDFVLGASVECIEKAVSVWMTFSLPRNRN